MVITDSQPVTVVPAENLVPVSDHLRRLAPIPPSRMFLINKRLAVYREKHPEGETFDASQGDGGASLPGVPGEILEAAAALQREHGSAYDMPFGTDLFRRTVVEQYWKLGPLSGLGPENVLATVGGRDALVRAYDAMQALGHGRTGDLIVVTRVPWISYNWGPYGIGANVLLAPGSAAEGWAYSEDALRACAESAARIGRKIAGVIITSPDNPTGKELSPERQAALGKAALRAGAAFVLYDWMYHIVTDHAPMDLNAFMASFEPGERPRLMFLDGLTKSLGASNIRSAHLIASTEVVKYLTARASHAVIPPFYGTAVAIAAYRAGFLQVARAINEPTSASRARLRQFIAERGLTAILDQGYYAFIHVGEWLRRRGWKDSEPLGEYLAEEHGLAVVPGAYFSSFGGEWIRFSYATPPDRTVGAARRLVEGLDALAAD
ncbi:MAG TPA: aminotransferase class I/II-fold pyridoxal phosphate-dependent enzyme [Anaerolineales bacterium]|nr:aminotransferase class I/II-fold pyridoxal phosphate-dependent enzyme [Anaerolineales bacterium]